MTEGRRHAWPGIVAVAAVTAALYLAGGLEWAERHLMDLRFAVQRRATTGQVAVVAIDPRSLESLQVWPWPRGYHATLLEELLAAGARRVAFDVDFSSHSMLEEDEALEEAVRSAGRRVLLPIFYQWQPTPDGGARLVVTRPLPGLAAHASLVSINILPDGDGLVRRYGDGVPAGSGAPPPLAAALAGGSLTRTGPFYIDFGIDLGSIPVISYLDVLTGTFPRGIFTGKSVIVGATALELGDQATVPLRAAVPGPLLQALAFESLASGRALTRLPVWVAIGLVLVVALGAGLSMQRVSWRGGLVILGAVCATLFALALLAQQRAPIILDIAPAGTALGLCYGLALMRRIDHQDVRIWFASLRARNSELRMRHVVENCSEAILTLDPRGRIETFNRAAEALFGRQASDALGRSLSDLVPDAPSEWHESAEGEDRILPGPAVWKLGSTFTRADGEARAVDMTVSSFSLEGHPVRVVFLSDVTERLRQHDRLRHQATHDALTDLPNRTLLFDRLRQALGEGSAQSPRAALLMLDLDRFKEINDTLGHTTGDRLLCLIAERLRERLDHGGLIARLGGDEFAVLLPGAGVEAASAAARRFIEALAAPFELQGMRLHVDISVGIALCPDHGREPGPLLQRADVAMYVAKRQRNTFCLYDEETDANSLRHLTLKGEMRDSIDRDLFELHFQPKLDLATERVVGAEALLRWNHPLHGPLPPAEFIPLAERTGLIRPLTHWVIRTGLNQAARWEAEGLRLTMAVNCSARNLLEEDLPQTIERLLSQSGVAADRLVLEITETAIIEDPVRSLRVLNEVTSLGVSLSIDDFGTAYSSLDYLRKLPATELKIDRSFVSGIDRDAGDATIVRATIRLAREFGLRAVAEGIESRDVLDRLREFGCDQGQGHFISPPLPADRFRAWLMARAEGPRAVALAHP